jgi:hypothetical protein
MFPVAATNTVLGVLGSTTIRPIVTVWSSPRCCQVAPPLVVFHTPSPG